MSSALWHLRAIRWDVLVELVEPVQLHGLMRAVKAIFGPIKIKVQGHSREHVDTWGTATSPQESDAAARHESENTELEQMVATKEAAERK